MPCSIRSLLNTHGGSYEYAIRRIIAWYSSEPGLTFNRSVVVSFDATPERYIGSKQKLQDAVNDRLGISVAYDTALRSGSRAASGMLAIASFNIHYLGWQTPDENSLTVLNPVSFEPALSTP